MTTGYYFDKEAIKKYKLSAKECTFINWLNNFMESGYQETTETGKGLFFWVKYQKIVDDIGVLLAINSSTSVYKFLSRLEKKRIIEKKVFYKYFEKRLYVRLNSLMVQELKNGIGGKDMKNDPFGIKESVAVPNNLNRNVVQILRKLRGFTLPDGRNLFSFKDFEKNGVITKSLQRFNKMLLDLYKGKFSLTHYEVNEVFQKQNNIGEEQLEELRDCKGNWDKITKVILTAAGHYVLWNDKMYLPLTKDWLTRDVSNWIHNNMSKNSLFLACMLDEPKRAVEQFSQKALENLPSNVYNAARELRNDFFPVGKFIDTFWFGINKTYKIEKRLKKLHGKEYMIGVWLNMNQDGDWTTRYIEWLRTCWGEKTKGMLMETHVGPGGKPWLKWIQSDVDLQPFWDVLYQDSQDDRLAKAI